MRCLLCDEDIGETDRESRCSLHPGACSFAFETGADAGRYDNDLAYRDIYFWSCCGKRTPSHLSGQDQLVPLRTPGCSSASSHKFHAKVLIAASPSKRKLVEQSLLAMEANGLAPTLCAVEDALPSYATSFEALCFVLTEESHTLALSLTESFARELPELPLVVFSEPERVEGWKIQALSHVNAERLIDALKGAVRNHFSPPEPWKPNVFLSYTHRDGEFIDRWVQIFSHFERGCWFDRNVLISGVEWSSEIVKGIEKSDSFVLVLTPNTPRHTYCWLELQTARKAGKPIFVISYGDSLSQFLAFEENKDIHWHEIRLQPRLSDSVSATVNDLDQPQYILFRPFDWPVVDIPWSFPETPLKSCVQSWPESFLRGSATIPAS